MSAVTRSSISCAERESDGPFRDVSDFARRINPRIVNKRALETLAAAGALDELGVDRATAFANVDRIIARGNPLTETSSRQGRTISSPAPLQARRRRIELRAAKPWVPTDRLSREFEAVGFFLTGHPLDDYKDVLEALGAETWLELAAKARTRRVVGTLAGTVLHARERKGKSGNAYAFVAFSDPTGQFEAVVFSEALAASRALLEPGQAVLLDVEAEADGETVKVRVQRLASLDKAAEAAPCRHEDLSRGYPRAAAARRAGRRQAGDRASSAWCSASTTGKSSSCCRKASTRRRSSGARSSSSRGVAAISAL